jgi:uncharacterized protein with PhoU and TrkA domain
MITEIKELKETLVNIFYFSMEHNCDEAHNEIVYLYEKNGLLKYIEVKGMQFE